MVCVKLKFVGIGVLAFSAATLNAQVGPALAAHFSVANHQETAGVLGYYRSPSIQGDTIIFTAEGDLWRVSASGGLAQRLTTHPGGETNAAISPDGKQVAFSASYEGPTEVYVMPIDGGVPARLTYQDDAAQVSGWTSDGRVLFSTYAHSTLPNSQLCILDPKTRDCKLIPLAQANDGTYSGDGKTLFFTRFDFQGSFTKRYQGGTAQNIWRWDGVSEAKPMTPDFKGTSRNPMWWNGRIYFESDRDGIMNIWSMDANGKDLKQHTRHKDYDVQMPSLGSGKIVYQHGADLWVLDLKSGQNSAVSIRLASDFDQMRERWVKEPLAWMTSAHISPDGSKVALTVRGQVFVAPVKNGRMIEATRKKSVRYREARFLNDGKSLVSFSDQSGEVELWKLNALGDSETAPEQLTKDSTILRIETSPSPDGKWIAHTDRAHRLFLYDTAAKTNKKIADSDMDNFSDLAWSPDGKYLAFVQQAENTFSQIKLYTIASGTTTDATTDRFNNVSPTFTPDGKYLFFLSDRNQRTVVGSPWGTRAPEPYFDKDDQIFFVGLQKGLRSPFQPEDELTPKKEEGAKPNPQAKPELPAIDLDGLANRLLRAPYAAGNYRDLRVCGNRLFFISAPTPGNGAPALMTAEISSQPGKISTVVAPVGGYETTPDGKKILANAGDGLLVFDANGAPANPAEAKVYLDGWTFSFDPKEEWLQMFSEAWRLHRDYLYAPNMQGVDWPAMRAKYRPLAERVTDRAELSDVLAQMVGEVSLLHTFVGGGDQRPGTDTVGIGFLGASWDRDTAAGGWKLTRIYRTDPDLPALTGPLLRPGIDLTEGDVIALIDGVSTLSVPDAGSLLRAKVGKQVRLRVYPAGDKSKSRDVIVNPISSQQNGNLRYSDWEYSRRVAVEKTGKGAIGYVHLRAMGNTDMDQWARDFYPVFNRQGLIIDMRHNGGGNIDSWILERLMRKAWMYWNQPVGQPSWNMQYAFRGHMVVLCDESTGSDGEAFSEGFRRLGLGKVIGTRTWGGEVWLTGSNTLVDNGVATAAEFGVYGPEGKWLIEGHGVDPDIVVDNLPYATFKGEDAQLAVAIKHLQDLIAKNPNPVVQPPAFPDRSFPPKKGGGGGGR